MRSFILLALVAVALATLEPISDRIIPNSEWLNEIVGDSERQIEERSFRGQREYRYVYNGQLATGIPHSSRQHAATRLQAVVSVVLDSEKEMLLQLTHIRMARLNRRVPNPRQMLPFMAFEQVPIDETLRQQLRLPVKCQYNNGLISEIELDGEEQPWSANIKRGVLNMLQVNLKQHGRTDMTEEQLLLNGAQEPIDPMNDFFACQEKTVEGECRTFYTITQQPLCPTCGEQQVMNVTKTIDFENCRRRPDIRYNTRFQEECPTCERKLAQKERVLESSTVARFNISGTPEAFLIEKVVVESQYMFAPVNEQHDVIATYVNQTLELIQSGPITTRVPQPNNPQRSDSQMVYTPDWDIRKERFFMEGDEEFHQKTPYSAIKNKVQFIGQILQRMVSLMHDHEKGIEEEAPRQLARLVKVLRMCTMQELEQICQKFREQPDSIKADHHQKVKDILTDALALAGTKNTIEHLIKGTKQRKIHPIKAALALKALVNTRVVSEQQIEMMLQLCKHQVAQRSPMLKQSCYLTVGSMMNAQCKDNKDQLAIEFKVNNKKLCPRQLKEKYVQELLALFQQSSSQYEKVLALKSLANAGIDMSVFELEKIIKDESQQPMIRSQAIDALRQLRSTMPRKIQKILMPVFKNKLERCDVRMVAVYQIIQTLPERAILDQLTQQLMQERCQHIVNFVISLMSTYANSTIPCERQVAEDLQLSLRHARAQPLFQRMGVSRFFHIPVYSQKLNMGAALNLGKIFDPDSYLPKELMASLDLVAGGQWHKNALQVGLVQQNSEELIEQMLGSRGVFWENNLEQLLTRGKRNVQQPKQYLRNLYKKLGIQGRRQRGLIPSAMLYMRFKNHDYATLPLDSETMPESIQELFQNSRMNIQSIEQTLSQGYHMNWHTAAFVHEMSRKIPTALGIPLVVSCKTPTIAGIHGHVKANIQPNNQIERINVQINARAKMASTMVTMVEAWTPVVNSGLKIVKSMQVNMPIDTEMEVDTQKEQPELKIRIQAPQQKTRVLAIQTRPVTYTRAWPKFLKTYAEPEEKTINGEEWNRVQTFDKQIGRNMLGVEMRAEGQWHRTPSNALAGTPCGAFAGHNFLKLTVQPGVQPPKEIVIKAKGQMFAEMESNLELQPEMDEFYTDEDEQEFFQDHHHQQPKSHFQKFKQYAKSFRGQSPLRHQLKIEIEAKGSPVPRKAELMSSCQCDQNMRFCKWQLDIQRSPVPSGHYQESQPWELNAKGQILYPNVPYTLKHLQQLSQENQRCAVDMNAKWGPKTSKNQHINIKIEGQRSREQIKLQQQSVYQNAYDQQLTREQREDMEVFSPVQQYEQLVKAAVLTKYNVHCEYKMNPTLRNVTNKVYRLLKNQQSCNTDVNQINVQNPEGHVHAVIEIEPRNLQYVNITMRVPRENVRIVDMPLPLPIQPLNLRRGAGPIRSISQFVQSMGVRSIQGNKCVVSSNRVTTFDQVRFRAPITTCYSVLAKDCAGVTEQPRFAVLMKKLSQQNDAKKVKIVTEKHEITMKSQQEEFSIDNEDLVEVKINERVINLQEQQTEVVREHGHVVLRVEKQGPYVKCTLPEEGVQVFFDGFAVSIKVSSMFTNAQCGLCGHMDGQSDDEFRMADNQLTPDIKLFHRSFLHQDEGCQIDEQILNNEEEYQLRPFSWEDEELQRRSRYTSSSEESSEENNNEDEEDSEEQMRTFGRRMQEPRQMTKVLEMSHEICFSLKPIRQCPRNTYPVKYQQQKKVSFGCLPRSSSEAQSLQRLIEQEQTTVQTSQMKQSFVETVQVPQKCQKF